MALGSILYWPLVAFSTGGVSSMESGWHFYHKLLVFVAPVVNRHYVTQARACCQTKNSLTCFAIRLCACRQHNSMRHVAMWYEADQISGSECRMKWRVTGVPRWQLWGGEPSCWDGKSTLRFDKRGKINLHEIDDKEIRNFWRSLPLWTRWLRYFEPAPESVGAIFSFLSTGCNAFLHILPLLSHCCCLCITDPLQFARQNLMKNEVLSWCKAVSNLLFLSGDTDWRPVPELPAGCSCYCGLPGLADKRRAGSAGPMEGHAGCFPSTG
jgi:hypothetical protein